MWAGVKYNKIKWNLNNLWNAFQQFPQRLVTGSRRQYLVEGNDDLQRDQRYDNQFETQGSLRVDDVRERRCGFGDYRKFSVKRINPLLQFLRTFQTSVEAFHIGTLLQSITFLGDLVLPTNPLLYYQ